MACYGKQRDKGYGDDGLISPELKVQSGVENHAPDQK